MTDQEFARIEQLSMGQQQHLLQRWQAQLENGYNSSDWEADSGYSLGVDRENDRRDAEIARDDLNAFLADNMQF